MPAAAQASSGSGAGGHGAPGSAWLHGTIGLRLIACLAAAGSLLGGARAVADVLPVAGPIDILPGQVDIDGDGNADLSFYAVGVGTRSVRGLANAGRNAAELALAPGTGGPYVSQVATGDLISAGAFVFGAAGEFGYPGSQNFGNGNPWVYQTNVTSKTGLIAGRFFSPADNQPRFFWLRIRLAQTSGSPAVDQVIEGAFESATSTPIVAGPAPAPTGGGGGHHGCQLAAGASDPLGILALGAAGIAALRRRRRPA